MADQRAADPLTEQGASPAREDAMDVPHITADEMSNGVLLIALERKRQVEEEGWAPEHDDEHGRGELAHAARCYIEAARIASNADHDEAVVRRTMERLGHIPEEDDDFLAMLRHPVIHHYGEGNAPRDWPWSVEWWKPSTAPVRNLVKAGALIAAEIDRLQRLDSAGAFDARSGVGGTDHFGQRR